MNSNSSSSPCKAFSVLDFRLLITTTKNNNSKNKNNNNNNLNSDKCHTCWVTTKTLPLDAKRQRKRREVDKRCAISKQSSHDTRDRWERNNVGNMGRGKHPQNESPTCCHRRARIRTRTEPGTHLRSSAGFAGPNLCRVFACQTCSHALTTLAQSDTWLGTSC